MNFFKSKNQLGFSILEVSLAMGVIIIGLLGVLSLVPQNIKAQRVNKHVLAASMLAQEGVELVRNIRDENWLTDGNSWKFGAGAGTNTDIVQDNEYIIDYNGVITDGTVDIDDNGSDDIIVDQPNTRLYLDANGFYAHGAGVSTPYYRLIKISIVAAHCIEVSARVQWREPQGIKNYIVQTNLYNWR